MIIEENNVIIINLYGGIPGALIEQAFAQLSAFKELKMCSTLYPRCAASHTSSRDTFLNLISNDHITQATPDSKSSIFKELKNMGFNTELRGPFGLKPDLEIKWNTQRALEDWGIDTFDEQDGFFSNIVSDKVHDEIVFSNGIESISNWNETQKNALMLNLMSCRSIEKLRWQSSKTTTPFEISINDTDSHALETKEEITNFIPYPICNNMKKYLSKSVIEDNIHDPKSRSIHIPYCLADHKHRNEKQHTNVENSINMSLCAHGLAWFHLCNLNRQLGKLLEYLKHHNLMGTTSIILLSTKGLSLLEHGAIDAMPWESSLRCFALIHKAGQSYSEVLTNALSASIFGSMILSTCNSNIMWKNMNYNLTYSTKSIMSIQLNAKHLKLYKFIDGYDIFTFPAFCIKCKIFYERWYSIVVWFNANMLITDDIVDKIHYLTNNKTFKNPVIHDNIDSLIIQIYDHMTDIEEIRDLYLDIHWKESLLAKTILSNFFKEVNELGNTLHIDFSEIDFSDITETTLSQPTDDHSEFTRFLTLTCGDDALTIQSSINDISDNDVTIFSWDTSSDNEPPEDLPRLLPGIFNKNWKGEITIGKDKIYITSDCLLFNNYIEVGRTYLNYHNKHICTVSLRKSKTDYSTPNVTMNTRKGRIQKMERRIPR